MARPRVPVVAPRRAWWWRVLLLLACAAVVQWGGFLEDVYVLVMVCIWLLIITIVCGFAGRWLLRYLP